MLSGGRWRGGNEGRVPVWAKDLEAVLSASRLRVLLEGAGESGKGGGGALFGTWFLVLLSSAVGWGG